MEVASNSFTCCGNIQPANYREENNVCNYHVEANTLRVAVCGVQAIGFWLGEYSVCERHKPNGVHESLLLTAY